MTRGKTLGTINFALILIAILLVLNFFGVGLPSLGGKVKAPCHQDGVFLEPTIEVDGKVIIEKGKLVL